MASKANVSRKAKIRKSVQDLSPKDLKKVVGGRKAGGSQQDFLIVKLTDVSSTGL